MLGRWRPDVAVSLRGSVTADNAMKARGHPIRRLLVAVSIAGLAVVPLPASANDWNGACLVTLHFTFSVPISTGGGSGPFTMTGTGTCPASGLAAPVAIRTISIAGDGFASNAKCAPLLLSGAYAVGFSPPPAPPPTNGIWSFNGTASAGVFLMTDLPIYAAVGVGVGTGALDCVQGGAKTLTFLVPFVFVDP